MPLPAAVVRYHCEADVARGNRKTFKVMERRLLRFIINPAMIATWFWLWLGWQSVLIPGLGSGEFVLFFLLSGVARRLCVAA